MLLCDLNGKIRTITGICLSITVKVHGSTEAYQNTMEEIAIMFRNNLPLPFRYIIDAAAIEWP